MHSRSEEERLNFLSNLQSLKPSKILIFYSISHNSWISVDLDPRSSLFLSKVEKKNVMIDVFA